MTILYQDGEVIISDRGVTARGENVPLEKIESWFHDGREYIFLRLRTNPVSRFLSGARCFNVPGWFGVSDPSGVEDLAKLRWEAGEKQKGVPFETVKQQLIDSVQKENHYEHYKKVTDALNLMLAHK